MRVVLDTNIIVSALLSPGGLPAQILHLVFNKEIKVICDNRIFIEYLDVLHREKLQINKVLLNAVMEYINAEGEFVAAWPQKAQCNDKDDTIFYEVYKSGAAQYLITGNKKHFPKEKGIVTPREFIEKEYTQ